MKAIVLTFAVIVAILSTGCATTEMSKTPNGDMTWKSRTLWKDISDIDAEADGIRFRMGNSVSADDARMLLALCLVVPTAEGCN